MPRAGHFSEALTSALAALELYRSTNERSSEGLLLNSLAVIQHSLRDTDSQGLSSSDEGNVVQAASSTGPVARSMAMSGAAVAALAPGAGVEASSGSGMALASVSP